MNIIIPRHSGFCYGVKRSVKAAFELADMGGAYMYGEVVHNPSVVALLQEQGVTLVHAVSDIPADAPPGTKVLLRAHGVSEAVVAEITARGFEPVDMTCPHVRKIHAIVAYASARGMDIIVCGTPGHPEVAGTVSRVGTRVWVVESEEEARRVVPTLSFSAAGVCLVGQTTHSLRDYEAVARYLGEECGNIPFLEPHHTICDATATRQNELRTLAETADVCYIVGGKNSSNVRKLYDIAREVCKETYHVESAGEVDPAMARGTVVIAGGASTPNIHVSEVKEKIQSYFRADKG